MKQSNHSTLDSLNFSMNSLTLVGRHGARHSFSEASFAPIHQAASSPTPHPARLQHAHSTSGEHLRSHSAILPDLAGSLDSSFGLLGTPTYGSTASLALPPYNSVLQHSASGSFAPVRSFSVQDRIMSVEGVVGPDAAANLALTPECATPGLVLNATESGLALNSGDHSKN